MLLRISTALALLACSLALVACGASARASSAHRAAAAACPAPWAQGWQRLANSVHVPVYCPGWIPNPLDATIGAGNDTYQFTQVDRRGGYLVSFLYYETGSTEVHVNFRRFPGTAMPQCRDLETTRRVPCYADSAGTLTANGIRATFYTVGRDADQWHLAYLWRHAGATYVVSEHVAPPYGFPQVKANIARIVRSLVLLQPQS